MAGPRGLQPRGAGLENRGLRAVLRLLSQVALLVSHSAGLIFAHSVCCGAAEQMAEMLTTLYLYIRHLVVYNTEVLRISPFYATPLFRNRSKITQDSHQNGAHKDYSFFAGSIT